MYTGVLLDSHWRALAPIMGEPDLAEHVSFATRDQRLANREACNVLLENWLADRTRDEAIKTLREAGLPIAPVNTYGEAARDPHVLERDMLQDTELQDGVTVPVVGPAVKFSRTPTRVRSRAPQIGEHNAEVLEAIGLDAKARQELLSSGVIS